MAEIQRKKGKRCFGWGFRGFGAWTFALPLPVSGDSSTAWWEYVVKAVHPVTAGIGESG